MIGSFLTVGEQVLILFALMAVGFALGKAKLMGDKGSLAMTNLVMYAVSPAMMVVAFQREKDTADLHNFLVCLLLAVAVHAVSILLACAALRGKDGTLRGAAVRRGVLQLRLYGLSVDDGAAGQHRRVLRIGLRGGVHGADVDNGRLYDYP